MIIKNATKEDILKLAENVEPAVVFLTPEESVALENIIKELEMGNADIMLIKHIIYKPNEEDFGVLFNEDLKREVLEEKRIAAVFFPPVEEEISFSLADPESLEGFYIKYSKFVNKALYGQQNVKELG